MSEIWFAYQCDRIDEKKDNNNHHHHQKSNEHRKKQENQNAPIKFLYIHISNKYFVHRKTFFFADIPPTTIQYRWTNGRTVARLIEMKMAVGDHTNEKSTDTLIKRKTLIATPVFHFISIRSFFCVCLCISSLRKRKKSHNFHIIQNAKI